MQNVQNVIDRRKIRTKYTVQGFFNERSEMLFLLIHFN